MPAHYRTHLAPTMQGLAEGAPNVVSRSPSSAGEEHASHRRLHTRGGSMRDALPLLLVPLKALFTFRRDPNRARAMSAAERLEGYATLWAVGSARFGGTYLKHSLLNNFALLSPHHIQTGFFKLRD